MTVFIVFEDDGDFYCEGNHIKGVYFSRESADRRITQLQERSGTGSKYVLSQWAIGEYEMEREYGE